MEGLTVDTCSLDGSRQTSYVQLLSLANSDVLSTANCQIPSILNAQKSSTIRIQPASFVIQNASTTTGGSSSLKKPFVIPSSNSNSDLNRFSIDKTITNETILCAYDDQQKTLTVLGSTNFGGRNFAALLNEQRNNGGGETTTTTNPNLNANIVGNNFDAKLGASSGAKKSSSRAKRQRGWPKGKKRDKVHPSLKTPKQPATAYNLFCNQRRSVVKLENPDLSLADIMKMLGKEWSCLPKTDKQKYVELAGTDMERYKLELNNYKKSPEYREYLKNAKNNANSTLSMIESSPLIIRDQASISGGITLIPANANDKSKICILDAHHQQQSVAPDDLTCTTQDLYCKDCNLYFHNLHNKMEHLRGGLHRKQNIKQFEEYLAQNFVYKKRRISRAQLNDTSCFKQPFNMNDIITNFYQRNREQEIEVSELRQTVRLLNEKNKKSRDLVHNYTEIMSRIENETKSSLQKRDNLAKLESLLMAVPVMFQLE